MTLYDLGLPAAFRYGVLLCGCLCCCLAPAASSGQSGNTAAENDPVAAARRLEARGERNDLTEAGRLWYAADSLTRSYYAYLAVAEPRDGTAPRDSLTALALHKIGLIYYDYAEDSTAAAYYLRSARLLDSLHAAPHNDRAHAYFDLATTLRYQGYLDSAITYARRAAALYTAVPRPDSINWLRTYNELAACGLAARDLQVADAATERALGLLPTISDLSSRDRFDTYFAAGRTRFRFRDYTATRQLAIRAVAVAETADRPGWLADALQLLANVQQQQQHPAAAERSYRRAADLLTALDDPAEELPLLYANLAQLARSDSRYSLALRYLDQAASANRSADPTTQRKITYQRGFTHRQAGDNATALRAFNAALGDYASAPSAPVDPAAIAVDDRPEIGEILTERARTLHALGDTDAALTDYEAYFALLDLMRQRVNSDASRRYLSTNLRPYFDFAVGLYVERHEASGNQADLWRALQLSERARAFSLLTAVERNRGTMPARERELRRRIAVLERSSDPAAIADLAAARLQLDRLLTNGRAPITTATANLNPAALQAWVAAENTDLLVYHLTPTVAHYFHLTATGRLSHRSTTDSLLADRTAAFREAITTGAYRGKSLRAPEEQQRADAAYVEAGKLLRGALLPPELSTQNLIIVPDGALTYLPFAALPLAIREHSRLNYATDLTYLGEAHQLSYVYAVRQLLSDSLATTDFPEDIIAFAPSFNGSPNRSATQRQVTGTDLRAIGRLAPLRYNEAEVAAITDLFARATDYYGAAASRENFLAEIGRGRILHLSTHGTMNAADPNLSFVAFTQSGDSLELEELLYFNDLSALPLRTELAVLSACETSVGEYVPGEVALSLASAFTAAGARSTLTTLWSVDDAATRELMVAFYRKLTAGKSRAEALSLAQEELRTGGTYAHPFYWAALSLHGNRGPLTFSESPSGDGYWLGVVVGLLLMGVLIWWHNRA